MHRLHNFTFTKLLQAYAHIVKSDGFASPSAGMIDLFPG